MLHRKLRKQTVVVVPQRCLPPCFWILLPIEDYKRRNQQNQDNPCRGKERLASLAHLADPQKDAHSKDNRNTVPENTIIPFKLPFQGKVIFHVEQHGEQNE